MKKESKTKIIATIGPASGSLKILQQMIKNKMDVVRLNMSYATHKKHTEYIGLIRYAAKMEKRKIPIIMDLSGPREKIKKGHQLNKRMKSVITDKDKKDVAFGVKNNVEFFAMSYVRSKNDIDELRKLIQSLDSNAKIIAKIERKEAVKNLQGIIGASDGIMVARGDLGDALPYEDLPYVQVKIIKECLKFKKPVIVATEMLFSMKKTMRPTRAEVSDVAFAVLEHADGVMLSDETAIGEHPAEAVRAMERIILKAEKQSKKLKKSFC